MFENLSQRLTGIVSRLRGRGALTEADVKEALREVRVALLEADVALPVVKELIQKIQEQAIGQEVLRGINPGQLVIKIVHDHLVEFLGQEVQEIELKSQPPAVILMAGLQGSGKTTMSSKLAYYLSKKLKKKVLMASLDVYRPAAREQLETLGKSIAVPTLPIIESEKPLAIAERALKAARTEGYDVLILDTAGRLHIDEELMAEVEAVKKLTSPVETILVADAMTGQDAVNIAKAFHERITLTGLALSRIDGDARGGAALSIRAVTGCPLKILGTGERADQFELFHPERIASRILGMGDVISLVEKAIENVNQEDAEKLAQKMQSGNFDLDDMALQLQQMGKMGGLGGIMGMLPGMGSIKDKMESAGMDDKVIERQIAIIRSMTAWERKNAKILNASRKRRIAKGSGTTVQDLNRLLKSYLQMSDVMKRMNKLGKKGLMRQGLRALMPTKMM